jgi:hypothetical protein
MALDEAGRLRIVAGVRGVCLRGARLWDPHPSDRHRVPEPMAVGAPDEPPGTEPLGSLHRKRNGTEDVPFGTADDGVLHQALKSLFCRVGWTS